ncbi:hypothetical protein [Campylobacter sp. CCUG 57310]|uniref:hypothetical protein n=1 Tax=Campylobacter sp. CCUG 57310 TaxID=2517362 RepID=UPI00156548E3|nr:hypothetical protein [Campylobacter sp. CCUG 57310]QKF91332.1 hypothetical protein CORI_0088 [Campylobacter sp. CCUG 57310]
MKKILISSLTAVALLSGCAYMTPKQEAPAAKVIEVKTIDFQGVKDKKYKATLISADDFETAVLTDTKGNKFKLKAAPAGSGTRLISDDGAEIHFKKGEAVMVPAKGQKEVFLKYNEE